ncbi:hypothetical protein Golob_026408 [Gossypium lobatum]|uniref:Uncharacterized protein n=1 Tax=Gossypium lobatum TaxID=34289 RepID=A0A7J8LUZ7_9ROSI|nr:hypothetical protein [Gossypium lobatum]
MEMQCNSYGEDLQEQPMRKDNEQGASISFKDMLIGSKRSSRKEVLETDVDDVQLFEGSVTVGTKDGIP